MPNIARTVAVALAALLPAVAGAQEASALKAWAALGVGAGYPATGGDGITNLAQLVVQRRPHHFAARVLVMHDIETHPLGDEIAEMGILYGRTPLVAGRNVTLATGISAVGFLRCPGGDASCFTPGLPLVAEVSATRRFVGIGAHLFANVNAKASYAGLVLLLQVGRH